MACSGNYLGMAVAGPWEEAQGATLRMKDSQQTYRVLYYTSLESCTVIGEWSRAVFLHCLDGAEKEGECEVRPDARVPGDVD